MNFKQARQDCYDLWNDLSITGADSKVLSNKLKFATLNACPACEFTSKFSKRISRTCRCDLCPVVWGDHAEVDKRMHWRNSDIMGYCEEAKDSPYRKWRKEMSPEVRKQLAAQIRDLPWTNRCRWWYRAAKFIKEVIDGYKAFLKSTD